MALLKLNVRTPQEMAEWQKREKVTLSGYETEDLLDLYAKHQEEIGAHFGESPEKRSEITNLALVQAEAIKEVIAERTRKVYRVPKVGDEIEVAYLDIANTRKKKIPAKITTLCGGFVRIRTQHGGNDHDDFVQLDRCTFIKRAIE